MQFGTFYKSFLEFICQKNWNKNQKQNKKNKILLVLIETQAIGNHKFCESCSLSSTNGEEKRLGFLTPWKIECVFNSSEILCLQYLYYYLRDFPCLDSSFFSSKMPLHLYV